jgi:uncharacterized protein YrzB (UPF0473 family)
MKEKLTFSIIDEDDKEIEYEIIVAFYWSKTKKNYLVYTDSTYTNDSLNIYASIYYPNDETRLDDIETDEEWIEIDNRLKQIQEGKYEK